VSENFFFKKLESPSSDEIEDWYTRATQLGQRLIPGRKCPEMFKYELKPYKYEIDFERMIQKNLNVRYTKNASQRFTSAANKSSSSYRVKLRDEYVGDLSPPVQKSLPKTGDAWVAKGTVLSLYSKNAKNTLTS
jgi:hypothetical protein